MMMMAMRGRSERLQIRLNGGVSLLGSGEIVGFEIGGQLVERRSKAVGGGGRRKTRDIVGLNQEIRD
jgi:hypothetical protein